MKRPLDLVRSGICAGPGISREDRKIFAVIPKSMPESLTSNLNRITESKASPAEDRESPIISTKGPPGVLMTASENIVRHCPKCGSIRVRRSRRRGLVERLLNGLGGAICRCHDCRGRQAWFGLTPIRLGGTDPESSPWTGLVLFMIGLGGGVLLIYWFLAHYSGLSG
jgi:predicted RNA-binding Zn-ribbon protein involved in translation (DUF1610 family)